MKVTWKDKSIAESDQTVVIERNQYFPPDSLKMEWFKKSETPYTYPWKGKATYWHLLIEGEKNEDAAWSYENPSEVAKNIKSHIAFD